MRSGLPVRALVIVAVAALLIGSMVDRSAVAQPQDCNRPMAQPITDVPVQGLAMHPTATKDGCWLFTGFVDRTEGPASGIAVSRRNGDTFDEVRTIPLPLPRGPANGVPMGMAITQDQKVLVVSHSRHVTFLDVERLTSGGDPVLNQLTDRRIAGSWGVALTGDDRYAFAAQQPTALIAAIDVQRARVPGASAEAVTTFIATPRSPINPAVSPDGRFLYMAVRFAPDVIEVPQTCSKGTGGEGVVQVVDMQRAATDPAKATMGWAVPAGCGPQNLAVSPDGSRLSVTAGGPLVPPGPPADNSVVVFDTRPLNMGEMPVAVGRVPMPAPPVLIEDTGDRIFVGFFYQQKPVDSSVNVLVIDPSKVASGKAAIIGTLPFPALYLSLSPDLQTLFASRPGTLSVVDLQRVKLDPVQQ